jgi:hypothetical protein
MNDMRSITLHSEQVRSDLTDFFIPVAESMLDDYLKGSSSCNFFFNKFWNLKNADYHTLVDLWQQYLMPPFFDDNPEIEDVLLEVIDIHTKIRRKIWMGSRYNRYKFNESNAEKLDK